MFSDRHAIGSMFAPRKLPIRKFSITRFDWLLSLKLFWQDTRYFLITGLQTLWAETLSTRTGADVSWKNHRCWYWQTAILQFRSSILLRVSWHCTEHNRDQLNWVHDSTLHAARTGTFIIKPLTTSHYLSSASSLSLPRRKCDSSTCASVTFSRYPDFYFRPSTITWPVLCIY